MISVIIPSYRNPAYLDLCLRSLIDGQEQQNDIVVIVDGFVDESKDVLKKYEGTDIKVLALDQNQGMAQAINFGVYNAVSNNIFIMNDDNVASPGWDTAMVKCASEDHVITFNQIEPDNSIFGFPVLDCGRSAEIFDYKKFIRYEETVSQDKFTDDGFIFPFLMSKRWFMAVGGFDLLYKSPFWVDVDFWMKLAMLDRLTFQRSHKKHFYHFGSRATKNRGDTEANKFRQSETPAFQTFMYKWKSFPTEIAKVMTARKQQNVIRSK